MELKRSSSTIPAKKGISLNRTFMELKLVADSVGKLTRDGLNRTFMELKLVGQPKDSKQWLS